MCSERSPAVGMIYFKPLSMQNKFIRKCMHMKLSCMLRIWKVFAFERYEDNTWIGKFPKRMPNTGHQIRYFGFAVTTSLIRYTLSLENSSRFASRTSIWGGGGSPPNYLYIIFKAHS